MMSLAVIKPFNGKIEIDPEFEKFLPDLSDQEFDILTTPKGG